MFGISALCFAIWISALNGATVHNQPMKPVEFAHEMKYLDHEIAIGTVTSWRPVCQGDEDYSSLLTTPTLVPKQ